MPSPLSMLTSGSEVSAAASISSCYTPIEHFDHLMLQWSCSSAQHIVVNLRVRTVVPSAIDLFDTLLHQP
jgi:hypothetical protein